MKKPFLRIALAIVIAYLYYSHYFAEVAEGVSYALLGLVGIDQTDADACISCEAGLARAIVVECEGIDLDATTFDPDTGCITGLAFTGVGFAAEYVPDNDNTSFLDFAGNRPTPKSFEATITGLLKFACLNKDKIAEANRLKDGCCFVIIAEYNDCSVMAAGLDIVKNCSIDGELRFSKSNIVITPSVLFGTGNGDESRLELNITGTQRCFTALDQTVQTFDDIVAAAGL